MSEIEDWLKTALPITAKMIHGYETDFSLRQKLYEQLDQLKAENEELRKENQEMYKMGCENFVAIDQAKRLYKLNKCLDEIEESFCKEYSGSQYTEEAHIAYWANQILQKIKEVKEQ